LGKQSLSNNKEGIVCPDRDLLENVYMVVMEQMCLIAAGSDIKH